MWHLDSESENDHRVIYIAGQNKKVLIGRNPDPETFSFVIPDDPSISRKHALLISSKDGLCLKDLGSRYGTFLNEHEEKIEPNSIVHVNDQDVIKFGKMGTVWKVNFKSLITCTSTLKGENLQNLKQCMSNLSGIVKNEWDDDCLFLTMPVITLTMKVVLALVQGAHIVTVDYWNKCLEAVNNQALLPDPKNFTPQILESTLNKEIVSFLPNTQRQSLFVGKKFVFFSKRQFEMYKTVLAKASATALLLSECKMTKSALSEENVIVIQYNISSATQETQNQRNLIQDINSYLKSKGRRVVTDVEIGLAVLYCSTEKYCNPNFNFSSEVIKQTDQNSKPSKVLALESQEQNLQNSHKDNVVIDESLSASVTEKLNSKRKVCDDNYDNSCDIKKNNNPIKKMAVDDNVFVSSNNSIKRKVSTDNIDVDSNPSKKLAIDCDSNDSQDAFNFVSKMGSNISDNNAGTSTKRLNLIKPQKRKLDSDDKEDDLFQFVQDKSKMPCTSKSNIFDNNKMRNIKTENDSDSNIASNKSMMSNNVDLALLRGAKLEELMKNNEKLLSNSSVDRNEIKQEIDEKMNNLSLGSTIVTVKKELIVKKEPVQIKEQTGEVKNFKKFKKVWPLKMQVTIVPRSSTDFHSQLDSGTSTENIST